MRAILLAVALGLTVALGIMLWAQDKSKPEVKPDAEQLQAQLKAANEQIAKLTIQLAQANGRAQFFEAGQALCEIDKKQPAPVPASAETAK